MPLAYAHDADTILPAVADEPGAGVSAGAEAGAVQERVLLTHAVD